MAAEVTMDALFGDFGVEVKGAQVVEGSRIAVEWTNGRESSLYPMLMLRDCCPCEECFSPEINGRLILFEDVLKASCTVAKICHQSDAVDVEWADGHKSRYSAEWLYRRRLEKDAITQRLKSVYTGVVDTPWSSSSPSEIIKSAQYNEIVANPQKVVEFTECLIKDGVFLIKGAPDKNCLVEFLQTIGAKHQGTHYGDNEWIVKNRPANKDLANSSKKLELHIDMPYLDKPQQLQLLHCLVQSADGGENKFSDALKAALILKERNPDYYKLLSTTEVDFRFVRTFQGKSWFICTRAPIIQENSKTGLPTLCRYGDEMRCCTFNQPIEVVEAWFEAFVYFSKLLEDNSIQIKSEPGDIIAFNNGRVLHAREAFDSSQARELEGVYADWDHLMSAWRTAKVKLYHQSKSGESETVSSMGQ